MLYTANDELPHSLNVVREAPLTPDKYASIIEKRNLLVLIDYLADAPFELDRPNKCLKCSSGQACEEIAVLLGHADSRPPDLARRYDMHRQYEAPECSWFRSQTALIEPNIAW